MRFLGTDRRLKYTRTLDIGGTTYHDAHAAIFLNRWIEFECPRVYAHLGAYLSITIRAEEIYAAEC